MKTHWVVFTALFLAIVSCKNTPIVKTECQDRDCVEDGVMGQCESNGFCSYPTSRNGCFSGLRWSKDAPADLAGQCLLSFLGSDCGCLDDTNPCSEEICVGPCTGQHCPTGRCVHLSTYDGNGCRTDNVDGICYDGHCCTGCWDGKKCHSGEEIGACGGYGSFCDQCQNSSACRQTSCASKRCIYEPVNGPSCAHCGAMNEPCCAGWKCSNWLTCQRRYYVEDVEEINCQPAVTCGDHICDVGAYVCCINANPPSSAETNCYTPGCPEGTTPFRCDGPEDCSSGLGCCGNSATGESACQNGCTPGWSRLCHDNAQCLDSEKCCPSGQTGICRKKCN